MVGAVAKLRYLLSTAVALLAQLTPGEALELKQKLVAQKKEYQPAWVPTLQVIILDVALDAAIPLFGDFSSPDSAAQASNMS